MISGKTGHFSKRGYPEVLEIRIKNWTFEKFGRTSKIILKTDRQNHVKLIFGGSKFNNFLVDFGSILGGPGGSNERVFWWLVGSWNQDAPMMPPRAPQDAPRAHKSSIFEDFYSILDWFLKIFGWFGVHFWFIFLLKKAETCKRYLVDFSFIFGPSFSRLLLSCTGAQPVIAEGDVNPAAPL